MTFPPQRRHRYGTRRKHLPNYAEEFKKTDEMLIRLQENSNVSTIYNQIA